MGWLSGWAKRLKITVNKDVVDAALSGFPVPVYISAASGIGDVDASCVFDELTSDANRKKIAVTTSDGETQCFVECERWDDANEKAWLHVKVPSVSADTDTDLYLYYDSSQADNSTYVGDTTDAAAQNVWDSDFVGVWHMGQDPSGGSGSIKDSTSSGNHGTPSGCTDSADLVDGKFGKAIEFDQTDDYINCGSATSLDDITAKTFEAIIYPHDMGESSYGRIAQKASVNNAGWAVFVEDTNRIAYHQKWSGNANPAYWSAPNNSIAVNTWKHVAITYDLSSTTNDPLIYVDAVSQSLTENISPSSTVESDAANSLWLGARNNAGTPDREFDGVIDEVRLSKTARSAAWIKATYNGLFDSLLTFSGEEILGEITDAAALGDTLDALHLAEILTDGVGLGDDLDGYYLRETVIDAVGMSATFDPLHLVDSITDGAGLGDALAREIEAIVAILDGAGLGDTVDGYYLREAITDAAALSDAFDGYFLRETITDTAGLGDSAARTMEIPRTLADTAGMNDAFVCLNWSEWLRQNSGHALKRFYFTLTGDGETPAVADAVIPISSFQARLRQGEPTYLSVVIPDLDAYSAIVSARSHGQMVIDMALILDGVEAVREEICRVDLEDINIYEGARNKSITLAGHATETYTTKITALTGASYYNLSGGLRRYRCAMDPYLKPGDTVRVNSEEFEVGYITISRSVGSETMEVVEAES